MELFELLVETEAFVSNNTPVNYLSVAALTAALGEMKESRGEAGEKEKRLV